MHDILPMRTQGHPHADLVRPLDDRIRDRNPETYGFTTRGTMCRALKPVLGSVRGKG